MIPAIPPWRLRVASALITGIAIWAYFGWRDDPLAWQAGVALGVLNLCTAWAGDVLVARRKAREVGGNG